MSSVLVYLGCRGGCDEHPVVKAPLRWVLPWAGRVMPQALLGHGAEAPVLRAIELILMLQSPQDKLLYETRLFSSCRREDTNLDI